MESTATLENMSIGSEQANEAELAVRVQEEPQAFGILYDRYLPRVYAYICCRVRDKETAEDLTSEVFERALSRIGSYRAERGSVAGWLFGIARNTVTSFGRRQRLRRLVGLGGVPDPISQAPTPYERAEDQAEWQRVCSLLSQLPDRHQEVIRLRYSGELSCREIGALFGLSESNVGTILHRGLSRLRELATEEHQ